MKRASRWHSWILSLWLLPANGQTIADFFDDGIMQDVWLEVAPADWTQLQAHYLENTYYPAKFTWNGIRQQIGIRSRGSGSRSPLKPNLLLKFDRYDKNQTFLGERAVVAKANNQDASNLREKITFDLFRRMGLAAPRESFARLHLNGEYLGLFALVEYLDEQFLSRNFGENTGYLYEWQHVDLYNFNYLGPDPATYAKFLDLKTGQPAPDLNNFLALIQAINLTSDVEFIPVLSKYLDPKLYLAHVAVENAVAETDGIVGGTFGMNNEYLYQFAGQIRYQFIPWDKDGTFEWPGWEIQAGIAENALARRLLSIPEYRAAYSSYLAKAVDLLGGPGGFSDRQFNRLYEMISEDARREPHKQCSIAGVVQPCGVLEFNRSVEEVRSFLTQRLAFVSGTLGGLVRIPTDPLVEVVSLWGDRGATISPGALFRVHGIGLGSTAAAPSGGLPRTLGNVWVSLDGIRAPLLSTSENEIQAQVPWGILPGSAAVAVDANGALSNTLEIEVANSSPSLLAVTHSNGIAVSARNPAGPRETVTAYAIGLGEVTGALSIGTIAPAEPLYRTQLEVNVSLCGSIRRSDFAGLSPGFVGLYQVNFEVPAACPAGTVLLELKVEGRSSSLALEIQSQ